jgi:hypothetical protein
MVGRIPATMLFDLRLFSVMIESSAKGLPHWTSLVLVSISHVGMRGSALPPVLCFSFSCSYFMLSLHCGTGVVFSFQNIVLHYVRDLVQKL